VKKAEIPGAALRRRGHQAENRAVIIVTVCGRGAVEITILTEQHVAIRLAAIRVAGEIIQHGFRPGMSARTRRRQLEDGADNAGSAARRRPIHIACRVQDQRRRGLAAVIAAAERPQHIFRPGCLAFARRNELEHHTIIGAAVAASVGGAIEGAFRVKRQGGLRYAAILAALECVERGLRPGRFSRRRRAQFEHDAIVTGAVAGGGAIEIAACIGNQAAFRKAAIGISGEGI
jgi:hypothetical protein